MSPKEIHPSFFTVPKVKLRDTSYDSGYRWKDNGNGKWIRVPKDEESEQVPDCFYNIRNFAQETLEASRDLLVIDEPKIEEVLLPRIARYLDSRGKSDWLPEGHNLTLEQEMGLNLFLDVVNFCYKDPESGHEYVFAKPDGKRIKRASGLLAAMACADINWSDFTEVSKISVETWEAMVQLSSDNTMYLGKERGERLADFAKHLLSLGMANMTDFLEECKADATVMVERLDKSGYFKDKFMKRSQLACRMISDVLVRRGILPLENIDKLTVMADYRIPQVFYNLGVVNLNSQLREQLLLEIPITSGSREEVVLRATAVEVGRIAANTFGVTEAEMDSILWGLSQEMVKNGQMIIPHMIVATDEY